MIINKENNNPSVIVLTWLLALVMPLILIPIEKFAPYPYVVEEITKAIFIYIIIRHSNRRFQFILSLIMSFIFAFSEDMFYSVNIIIGGVPYNLMQRFLLTTSLHLLTTVIILIPSQRLIKLIAPATIFSILIHYCYNKFILLLF